MKIYLCAVTARYPENYQIGLHALRWGVEERYSGKIAGVRRGDTLVFLVGGEFRSIHRIESDPFMESTPLWPPKDGSLFPHRIKIGPPLYKGHANANQLAAHISFMRTKERWTGTLQGPHGIFNPRLTPDDLSLIQSHLHPVVEPAAVVPTTEQSPAVLVEPGKVLFQFFGNDLENALLELLPGLGLTALPADTSRIPARKSNAIRMLCSDQDGSYAVVHLHRGQAPAQTLLEVLHDMSWARQNMSNGRDVRGVILSEAADSELAAIAGEVPNVTVKGYRLAIALTNGSAA